MKRCLCACVGVLFLGLTGGSPVGAVQMEPMSIEQLACESALVVRGTVLRKSCQRDAAGRLFTKVELRLIETWKGAARDNLTVVHGGGILGNRKTTVSGQVEYGIGEDVVVFLVLNPRGEAVTLGLGQGKFRVATDPRTGEQTVQGLFHGADGSESAVPPAAGPPRRDRMTLAELRRRVQTRFP
jgi:hypothetical protein